MFLYHFSKHIYVPNEGIPYFDAPQTISFPRGIDRVVFWESNLEKADRWLKVRSHNTVGNRTILVEGLRSEYVSAIAKHPAVYCEDFVKYEECGDLLPPPLIAAVLLREPLEFRVAGPIHAPELQSIIEEMQKYPLAKETTSTDAAIVFSDEIPQHPALLVTTQVVVQNDPRVQVVAKWGSVCLYRIHKAQVDSLEVVRDWKNVPSSTAFIWSGRHQEPPQALTWKEARQSSATHQEAQISLALRRG
jgi:hypothetical protein